MTFWPTITYNELSQDATDRGHTLSNAVFLPLIPFCLLGFFNSLFILCGSQILKRTMNRASLVSFLGNTEKERTMGVDMTRVFCYSVLQLTFQVLVSTGALIAIHCCFKSSITAFIHSAQVVPVTAALYQ